MRKRNGNKIGPGIMLRVMSGDAVNIRATSWYKLNGASPGTPVSPLNDLIVALSRGVSAVTTDYRKFTITQLQSTGVLSPGIGDLLSQQDAAYSNSIKPKAYLNWILLDEQFKLVSSSSGFEQVGDDNELKTWVKTGLPINRNGYLYVYTSNESPVDVFFDNLQVTHIRGPLQEETHYYPFGLTMAGISSKAAGKLENRFKYNGIELDSSLGLNAYEAHFRDLDPAIGRWWQIDPKIENDQESWSPYSSMANDPVLKSDPLGDEPCCQELWADIKSAVVEAATAAYNGAVSVARVVNQVNPLASAVEVITGKSSASDFTEAKSRIKAVADLGVNTVMMLTGEVGAGTKTGTPLTQGAKVESEVVQRAMSKEEAVATKETGLVRGGREGTHHVSDAIGNDAKRVRQRLALDRTPEVKVTMKVPKGHFSAPTKIDAAAKMAGGGLERKAYGKIPAEIIKVKQLKNTGQ